MELESFQRSDYQMCYFALDVHKNPHFINARMSSIRSLYLKLRPGTEISSPKQIPMFYLVDRVLKASLNPTKLNSSSRHHVYVWCVSRYYLTAGMVGLDPNWVRLAPEAPNALKSDLQKPRICPIWGHSDPIWMLNLTPLAPKKS